MGIEQKLKELSESCIKRKKPFRAWKKYGKQILISLWSLEALGILCVVGVLFYNRPWAGLLFSPFVVLYVRDREKGAANRRKEALTKSFREGMQSISASLAAGYSMENAFREAVNELQVLYGPEDPAMLGFSKVVHQLSLNRPLEEVFLEYAEENDVEEIQYFAQILVFAKRSGGNLVQIVRRSADMISGRLEVQQEIQTITTAKRYEQNIMNIVPIGMITYMRISSFSLMEKLYGNLMGVVTMTGCLLLYYAGIKLAKHIVEIEV